MGGKYACVVFRTCHFKGLRRHDANSGVQFHLEQMTSCTLTVNEQKQAVIALVGGVNAEVRQHRQPEQSLLAFVH